MLLLIVREATRYRMSRPCFIVAVVTDNHDVFLKAHLPLPTPSYTAYPSDRRISHERPSNG